MHSTHEARDQEYLEGKIEAKLRGEKPDACMALWITLVSKKNGDMLFQELGVVLFPYCWSF